MVVRVPARWPSAAHLDQALAVELPHRVHHRGMEGAAPGIEHALVRDLVRQRVLEGVFDVRDDSGLVDELGGLQGGEPPAQRLGLLVADRLQKAEWKALADDRRHFQNVLLLDGQPVDARR